MVGRNKAQVTTETVDKRDLKSLQSKDMMRQVGEILKPFGNRLLGSASIFYYAESVGGAKDVWNVVELCLVEQVPEGLADFGHKRLREVLMNCYGRQPQRRR